jgi:hypothetical protein
MSSAPDLHNLSDELRLDAQNPWPGLTAFTEKQHEFFYGRSQESHELFSCVKRERLTVLFGKSGLGKTSLLQAGLFPQLRDTDYLPVYVRLSYEDGAAPFDTQLGVALGSAIESAHFAEVALPQQGESVWEYLHRRGGNLINDDGNVVMPVLIFDQFEECFTLGARKDFSSRLVNEFLPGLAEMIENRTPASLTKKLTEDRDLAKRYDLEAHGCRILITLREDYLANLEALRDSMPSLVYIDNRMRLTEMTGEQALSVVLDPSPDLVDPGVAESIVRFVAGAHTDSADGNVQTLNTLPLKQLDVAPAILSLFCSQLNEERLKSPGMTKITRALVLSQGVTIIEDFYKKCIAGMHPAVRRLIEDRLLTSAGYRDNIDLAEARTSLERAGADPSFIDELVKLRLLQIEDHRGVPRLELTHDVLAEPVKHSRDEWKKEQQHEAAQQQERDALLRAKEAEQEARKRTRFLQKMVAAAAAVCLLLAVMIGFLIHSYVESKKAIHTADLAAQSEKRADAIRERAEQNQRTSRENESKALAETAKAKDEAAVATRNELVDARNAKQTALEALKNKSAMLAAEQGMQKHITGFSTDILNYCVRLYSDFDATAKTEKDGEGKDSVRLLYEHLLLGDGQCLDLAKEAHSADPGNIDVTDSLSMIAVRAAASAADRNSNPDAVRQDVLKDFQIEQNLPIFAADNKDDVSQLMLARAYLAFAFILNYIHVDSAQAVAERGLNILATLRVPAKSNDWNYQEWDILGEADNWYAIYLQGENKSADAIAPLKLAFDDAKHAADLAPKAKQYYIRELLDRSTRLADTERDLGDRDEETIQFYEQALTIAKQQNDEASLVTIYTDLRVVMVRDKKYDDATALLASRIKSLSAAPQNTQRDRDLAQAYRDAAEVEEARKQWPQAAALRAHVVEIVSAMKPADYTNQPSDLVYAYSLLSWSDIYSGQVDKGIADARKAISLSSKIEDQPGLYPSYENVVNALTQNKKYDDAEKFLDEFTHLLLAAPSTADRERELATEVDVARVRIAQATNNVQQAAKYRSDAVTRLAALKPDAYSTLKADLVSAYGNLSFEQAQAGNFVAGLEAAKAGLKLDPSQTWIEENEANDLLLSGHPDEAKTLYMKIKDIQWQGAPMSKAVSDDFLTFCKLGYTRPEMTAIAHDLNLTDPDLHSCLAAPPKTPK